MTRNEKAHFVKHIAELQVQLEDEKKKVEQARKDWAEEARKASEILGAQMENDRLKKREELVGMIAAGKNLEAINFILTTQVMLFKMDIRFADDQTRIAAEDEMLKKLIKIIQDSISNITVTRKPKAEQTC